ncbi:MAG: hypothetical protein V1874_07710 [Spirochaetota bacterium]
MINSEIQKEIINDLSNLPIELQKKVKEFTHTLLLTKSKGIPGRDILKFSGIIDDNNAEELRKIIDEGCSKVDYNEW